MTDKSEYREQVLHVRNLLAQTGADLREAIAQISLLPDTRANAAIHKLAGELEERIRKLESQVMGANRAAFEQVK